MFEWLKKLFKKKKDEAPASANPVCVKPNYEDEPLTVGEAIFPELFEDDHNEGNADYIESEEATTDTVVEFPVEEVPQIEPEEEVPVTEEPDEKTKKIITMAIFYLNTEGATLQMVAKEYGVSSTTVSKYFSKLLPGIDTDLACKVKEKLEKAKAENVERLKASAKKAKK